MTEESDLRRQGAGRWVVLGLMSLIIFANYYLYDSFSTLKEIIQKELSLTSTDYGVIRSFYNVPNTFLFMALIGGIFLDRFGIRKTGLVFTLLCALGGVVMAYGASPTFREGGFGYGLLGSFLTDYSPAMKMMILGRLLFGLGAETQIVMLNKVLAKWFKGKELALAFGLNLGVARIGSALAMAWSPMMAEDFFWNAGLWLAAVIMCSGLILFIAYMLMDRKEEKKRRLTELEKAPDEEFRMSDILAILKNRSFLAIALLCTAFYSAVFPFLDYLADLLTHEHGYNSQEAGNMTSLVPYGAAVFTVLMGAFVDWKGKRASLMIGGAFLLMFSHLLFGLTHVSPWIVVPLFGVAFSLVPAAMWPAVALIVPERRLGTAYGLMGWMQNFGWWGFTILAGWVLDKSNPDITPEVLKQGTGQYDYTWTMVMFSAVAGVAVFLAFVLKRVDQGKDSHGLELPSAEAAALNETRLNNEQV